MDSPDFPTEEEAQKNQAKDIKTMKKLFDAFFWYTMGALSIFGILLLIGTYYDK